MSLEKIKLLENRLFEILEYIKVLQKDRKELEQKLSEKENELKEAELKIDAGKKMETEYSRIHDERGEVRTRIEKILDTLKGIEGVK